MKKIAWVLLCVLAFIGLMFAFFEANQDWAKFLLMCLTPIGTISAVLTAIYGDFIRDWLHPIKLVIEPLKESEISDRVEFDYSHPLKTQNFSHHLRVRNLTPKKRVENCQVWLKRIYIVDDSRNREQAMIFSVHRLMEWAPSEYSPDKRTFVKEQIFDVGMTTIEGFRLTIHRDQTAAINQLLEQKGMFMQGAKIRCIFYLTADNYHQQEEFSFDIIAGTTQNSKFSVIKPFRATPKQFVDALTPEDTFISGTI